MSPAIITHELSKHFGDFVAVDSLDLEVARGEVFGFLGPNGAGKSTTIRCLLDLSRPTTGRAEILGFDTHRESLQVHRNVGYLPGDLALYGKLTGAEMLEYLANLRGHVSPRTVQALAHRFDADLSKRCSTYSSGNRQKIGLIQAFMHEPAVLILDEPTGGLDPLVQQSLHELIKSVRDEGRTVFLSSHTLSEVERVADRVGIIRHGVLVEVSSISDLKTRAVRRLDFEFAAAVDPTIFRAIGGVRDVSGTDRSLSIAYEGSVGAVLAVAATLGVVNLRSREADLEEIFLEYYRDRPAAPTLDAGSGSGSGSAPTPERAMLLTDVTTKTVRERSPLACSVGAGVAVGAFLMVMVAEALGEDMATMIADLPEALTGIMGGVGTNYVVTELFGIIAPVAVLTVSIGGGVNAVAGEERRHTADLLLTQPVSRRSVVRSKSIVLVGDTLIVCAFLLAGSALGATLFGVTGFGPNDAVAAVIHLFFLAIAFGALALAVGNATGSSSTGTAAAVVVAVVANLLAGILPLVEGAAGYVRLSPWYYFNGSEPLVNGVDLGHLGVLGSLALASFGFALWVVDHRDIGAGAGNPTRRLLSHTSVLRNRAGSSPRRRAGTIAGPRVGSIVAKTLTERTAFVVILSSAMAAMSVLVSLMYPSIKGSLIELNDAFPPAMLELFGATDMSTPDGFIQVEMLSLMTPIALIALAVVMGVDAIAGEASRRTIGFLLAAPIPRARVVAEKAVALILAVAMTTVGLWLGLVLGSAIAGIGLSVGGLAAALIHQMLLAVFFGMLALAIGSATERSLAVRVTMAVIVVTYFGNWLLGLRTSLAAGAKLSPWYYAVEADPMRSGIEPVHLAVLAAGSAILLAAAVWGFQRRDLDG